MISEIDQDGNGEISFNEFVWLMTRDIHDDEIEDDIREAFRCFDKDGHGFIPISGKKNNWRFLYKVLPKLRFSINKLEVFIKLILQMHPTSDKLLAVR